MKHKIEVAPNLAIYIDGERVIGSKPHGLFLITEMIVSDEDLKRLADRCLEVIADRKTESILEKPNNCELQTIRCPKCGRTDYIRDMEKDMGIKGSCYKYKCVNCNTYIKDEATISKMEQVGKDINVCSKEPQSCETCKYGEDKHRYAHICNECGVGINNYEPKDECIYCDSCDHKGCEYCISDSRNPYCIPSNYEPRMERNE
jgi:hypothetical protein